MNGFLNMENVKILPYKTPKIKKKSILEDTSGYCKGTICLQIPTESSYAVILRGQPSFKDKEFTRYGFCDFLSRPGYFRAISS